MPQPDSKDAERKKKVFLDEAEDFFHGYEELLIEKKAAIEILLHTLSAHPKFPKQMLDCKEIPFKHFMNKWEGIAKIWGTLEFKDEELDTRIDDFGFIPEQLTVEVEDSEEATNLLGAEPKPKKPSLWVRLKNKVRIKPKHPKEPNAPEASNVVWKRRKAVARQLNDVVKEYYDQFKIDLAASMKSADSARSPLSKTKDPVPKDRIALKLEEMATDVHLLYYAVNVLEHQQIFCRDDTLHYIRTVYQPAVTGKFNKMSSVKIISDMNLLLKSKLCFEIMQLVLETTLKKDPLFLKCEEFKKEQDLAMGQSKEDQTLQKGSKKRTTDDEPLEMQCGSPAKQQRTAESSKQEPKVGKLVDLPTPEETLPKPVGTKPKSGKLIDLPSPGKQLTKPVAMATKEVSLIDLDSPKKRRPNPIVDEPNLIDFNSPAKQQTKPAEEEPDLIDFTSPKKLPTNPTEKPKDDSDEEDSKGVTKQFRRTSVEDQ